MSATAGAGGRKITENVAAMDPKTRLCVDALIIEKEKILLVKRKFEPCMDMWALPGGFVEYGEKTEDAVVREVKEETGLEIESTKLFNVYSDPDRDPRGHTVTIVYFCKAKEGQAKAADDAKDVWWWPLDDLPKMGFDHMQIISDIKNR